MASSFPTSLQDLDSTRGSDSDKTTTPNHVTHHTLEDDTIEALQAKVGIDGSAVATSLDYYIKQVIGQWTNDTFDGDGSTTTFTLTSTPISGSVMLFYEGTLAIEDTDWTLSSKDMTTTFTPENGTKLIAWYRKIIS